MNERHAQNIRAQVESEGREIGRVAENMHEMSPETMGDAITEIRDRCVKLAALRMELHKLEYDNDRFRKLRDAGF